MRTINLNKIPFDTKGRKATKARLSDITGEVVKEEAILKYNGKTIAIYKKIDESLIKELDWAVRTIKFSKSKRTSGLKTSARVFGFSPRIAIRNDYCAVTALSREFPKQHYIICKYAKFVNDIYKEYLPELYKKHYNEVTNEVLNEWLLPETPFTSGIINKNNYLGYHYDAGNFKDVASNMISLKKRC